jgi:hypothetical protein
MMDDEYRITNGSIWLYARRKITDRDVYSTDFCSRVQRIKGKTKEKGKGEIKLRITNIR